MAEDISNYRFYFIREAESLLHNSGQAGRNILFVETEATPAANARPPALSFPYTAGDEQLKGRILSKVQRSIEKEYARKPSLNSFQCAVSDDNGRKYPYVSFREKGGAAEILGDMNEQLMHLFILYHETGHALIPNDALSTEFAADAYAALRLLQRFGSQAKAFLSMLSWARAIGSVFNGVDHLTTTVLDKIIDDSARHNNFMGLNPEKTIARAQAYGKNWRPAGSILIAAENALTQAGTGGVFKPELLASTCLSSPASDFTFYIATRILKPYLELDEVICKGNANHLTREQKGDYETTIAARIVTGIFNRNSTGETLPFTSPPPVILPRGQTRLIYKPRPLDIFS